MRSTGKVKLQTIRVSVPDGYLRRERRAYNYLPVRLFQRWSVVAAGLAIMPKTVVSTAITAAKAPCGSELNNRIPLQEVAVETLDGVQNYEITSKTTGLEFFDMVRAGNCNQLVYWLAIKPERAIVGADLTPFLRRCVNATVLAICRSLTFSTWMPKTTTPLSSPIRR
jgi:hypothetical protein